MFKKFGTRVCLPNCLSSWSGAMNTRKIATHHRFHMSIAPVLSQRVDLLRERSLESQKRTAANWKKQKNEKATPKKKKDPGFSGFDDSDDPFGVSRQTEESEIEQTQKKKGGRIDADFNMDPVEDRLNEELDRLKMKLSELRLGRPTIGLFDSVPISLNKTTDSSNQKVPLSEIAQIAIKSANLVVIRLFQSEHSARVVAALRAANKQWQPMDEGDGQIRIALAKTTREARTAMVNEVKRNQLEYLDALREIESNTIADIKDTVTIMDWGQREVKRLQKILKPFHEDGKTAVQNKIKELTED